MRSYFAKQGRTIHSDSWLNCIGWAREQITLTAKPVHILTARPGEKNARIVAEITTDGERRITDGRVIKVKELRRGQKR